MKPDLRRKLRKIERLVEAAQRLAPTSQGAMRAECVQIHYAGYAEPGYDSADDTVVVTGDWNRVSRYDAAENKFHDVDVIMPRLAKALERAGAELEWEDEWAECGECNRLVRTSGNSYGWTPSYAIDECTITCHACLTQDPEAHLASLENNPRTANTIDSIDPAAHGYVKLDDYERGLYGGQSADPREVAKALRKRGVTRFLFQIDSVGQFDMDFSAWVHETEQSKLTDPIPASETSGSDPARMAEQALRQASALMSELPDGAGIKYAKIDCDTGTVEARIVSPEEFVNGIK